MRAYAADGHFKAGSMGPKVEACLRFVHAGGEAVIASLTEVGPAMAGEAGTHIVPDAAKRAAKRPPPPRVAPRQDEEHGQGRHREKAAAPKRRPGSPARTRGRGSAADVIDIGTARRRAAAE